MSKNENIYGLMSGTSLDGLDVAICTFSNKNHWKYDILHSETIPYSKAWETRLANAHTLNGESLVKLDREYGNYLGEVVNDVIKKTGLSPFMIASHGHTVFHNPTEKYTLQIGSGAQIAAHSGCLVINDFRSTDVALGGQGAPLVPIGDKLLFPEFTGCLNLGGFANISFDYKNLRCAFDICPVNFVFNYFAGKNGQSYDKDGELGRAGKINTDLLKRLNAITFYELTFPKSLGREWMEKYFFTILNNSGCNFEDQLRTCYEHIAFQLAKVFNDYSLENILITGGGAYNNFLMELLKQKTKCQLIIPDHTTINYKEALIFAFMGWLRYHEQINCLSSVTGAIKDSIGGSIYIG